MQLVLVNNRIIAHGEGFLAMDGVVINTETGAKYENATIAECDNCPSDIGEVGYEYHAGVFKPCAPYGKGNNDGFFMEVCVPCATPRNSGIPINNIKYVKLAGVSVSEYAADRNIDSGVIIPISKETFLQYESLRYVIKKGSSIEFDNVASGTNKNFKLFAGDHSENDDFLLLRVACSGYTSDGGYLAASDKSFIFEEDYEIQETFRVGRDTDDFSVKADDVVTHSKKAVITTEKSNVSGLAIRLSFKIESGVTVNLNVEILGRKI